MRPLSQRAVGRLFWVCVSLVGAWCLLRLAVSSHEARYLVGLPAFILTMAWALD